MILRKSYLDKIEHYSGKDMMPNSNCKCNFVFNIY